MMKHIIYLAFLVLFFTSCNKIDTSIAIYIEGVVVNAETTETMEGVNVEIFTNNKSHTAVTDENGYFNLGKFPIGDYSLIISKEGFSTSLRQIFASQELLIYDVGFEMVKSYVFGLYPLNEELELTILRRVQNGLPVPAVNFPFKISTGDINSIVEGTTDENGIISLENMPLRFKIFIDHDYNNVRYRYNSYVYVQERNYVIVNGYNAVAYFGIASANILDEDGVARNDFPVSSPIELNFTLPVDTINSDISLEENGWNDVSASYKWTDTGRKLTITPSTYLTPGTNYEVRFNMRTEDSDQSFYGYIGFFTAE